MNKVVLFNLVVLEALSSLSRLSQPDGMPDLLHRRCGYTTTATSRARRPDGPRERVRHMRRISAQEAAAQRALAATPLFDAPDPRASCRLVSFADRSQARCVEASRCSVTHHTDATIIIKYVVIICIYIYRERER